MGFLWGSLVAVCASAESGEVCIPVVVKAPDSARIAGVQFDFQYDPEYFAVFPGKAVEAGPAALAADKQANFTEIAPGLLRVIILGFNQTTIAPGEVARVRLASKTTAPGGGGTAFGLTRVLVSNPLGNRLTAPEVVLGPHGGIPRAGSAPGPGRNPLTTPQLLWPVAVLLCALGAFWAARRMGKNALLRHCW